MQNKPHHFLRAHTFFFIFFIYFFISNPSAFSQKQASTDSLILLLRNDIHDTTAIDICRMIGDNLLNNQPDTAISYYMKGMVLVEKQLGAPPLISKENTYSMRLAKLLLNTGTAFYNQGNFDKATEYSLQALKIWTVKNDRSKIASANNNLGVICYSTGDYEKALQYYRRALETREALNDRPGLSSTLTNIGNVYLVQANYYKSLEYHEKALDIRMALQNKTGIAISLNNIGVCYLNLGKLDKAMEYFQGSLKLKKENNDKAGLIQTLDNIGTVLLIQGFNEKALDYNKQSLQICRELGNNFGEAFALSNIGNVYYNMNDYKTALKYYSTSLKIKERYRNKFVLMQSLYDIGSAYEKLEKYKKAGEAYKRLSILAREQLHANFNFLSEKEKELLFETLSQFFNIAGSYAARHREQARGFESIVYDNELLLKGIQLQSGIVMKQAMAVNADSKMLKLYNNWIETRIKLEKLYNENDESSKKLVSELDEKANEQERELMQNSKEFSAMQKLYTTKWQDIKNNLQDSDAAIEYLIINQEEAKNSYEKADTLSSKSEKGKYYYALIVRNHYDYPQLVRLCSEDTLLKVLEEKPVYDINIFPFIWKPLESFLQNASDVYVSPTGMLHRISFDALKDSAGKYLIDKYRIHLVSSTREIAGSHQLAEDTTNNKKSCIVYGGITYNFDAAMVSMQLHSDVDSIKYSERKNNSEQNFENKESWEYLPGTLVEANNVADIFEKNNWNTTILSGYKGTEESFKNLNGSASPGVLHISTHGFFLNDIKREKSRKEPVYIRSENPLFRAGLIMAGANRSWTGKPNINGIDDGVLTAYEVSNMYLPNTDLVVLSACETGLGEIKGDEGVFGLQRAFRMAGAKALIMSLWQVPDDETIELMTFFYTYWLQTRNRYESFHRAQVEMSKKYDPYYWAAFVLIE